MQQLKLSHIATLLTVLVLSGCNNDDDKNSVEPPPVVNKAPTASADMVTTQTEVTIEDMLQGTDPEGDTLTFSLVTEPMLGMVVVNTDGSYVYTPNAEATGTDSFTFAVSDGVNEQVTAMVDITIEVLEVDFAQFSRAAFNQAPTDKPLSVNGRTFPNADAKVNYDDLLTDN